MKWVFFLLLMIIFFSSCTTQSVKPSRNSIHIIDTTFQQQTLVLQPRMDTLCDSVHAVVFKQAVDSLLDVRKIEMNNLVK